MKYICILILSILLIAGCNQETTEGFSINAKVENGDSKLVKISARENGQWIDLDTAIVENGAFSLNGKIDNAQMLYLRIMDGARFRYVPIFSDNKNKISIVGDLSQEDDMIIKGSELTDLYNVYNSEIEKQTEPMVELYEMYEATERQEVKDSLEILIEQLEKESDEITRKFILENANSPVAAYVTTRGYSYGKEYDDLKPIIEKLAASNPNSKYLPGLQEKLTKLKALAVGQPAPNFIQKDVNGEDFDIESLKGKYVLIDFWASWCGPCRKENPNVVALYNELKDEDFEILGVSLDTKEDAWKKAIKDDGLDWEHVSDLKYFDNEVAKMYSVNAIPQTYLLDKNGVIVAKNLYGNKLKNKINELLKADS